MSGVATIRQIARHKGYVIYDEPYKLNIWGVRSTSVQPNSFDDKMHVFFNTSERGLPKWVHFVFSCTTDPGTYWLKKPLKPEGTGMLAEGQYVDVYKIDLHRGKYLALCQRRGKVKVIRDYNRDAILDFTSPRFEWGMFGINIHRARKTGTTYEVDIFSAGCQVFQKAGDFKFFMQLCEMHRKIHGNKFTYTLIDKRAERRQRVKRSLAVTMVSATAIGAVYWWLNKEKQESQIAA